MGILANVFLQARKHAAAEFVNRGGKRKMVHEILQGVILSVAPNKTSVAQKKFLEEIDYPEFLESRKCFVLFGRFHAASQHRADYGF